MYIPPLNEFSNLNYQQKIHIVENIQKMIEDNKKNYLKKYNYLYFFSNIIFTENIILFYFFKF
jgi:hypothetical protein